MTCCDFQTTTHGKWILAGEHAVLRGHPALVFPIPDKTFTLQYHASSTPLTLDCSDEHGDVIDALFWKVLEHAMRRFNRPLDAIHGHIQIHSNIPIGVGLGASAALCVAMSRWFASFTLLADENIQSFAQELEHLFHGQSSGVDVAGVAALGGIYFQQGVASAIQQKWEPKWRLSNCGDVGMTAPCVQAVQALQQTNAVRADALDRQMRNSVLQARAALEDFNAASRDNLTAALCSAADCFQQWGLVTPSLERHMQTLRDEGALAVKPTGSGGGGYAISLWP